MPDEKLGVKQRAVMITLMGEGRSLSNTEMKATHGLVLDGKDLRRLNDLGYVVSNRANGRAPYVHVLTERGWKWCRTELTAGRPRSSREESLGKALYAVLAGLGRYLDHIERGLAEVFAMESPPEPESMADRIRAIYQKLAERPGDPISLTDLRLELDRVARAEVDEAFRELSKEPGVMLAPEEDQGSLTDQDRVAALRVGNQNVHLLTIESS